MATSDGTVLGLVKLHDAGLPADRLNLVITSDGYTAAEMADFEQHADDFVAHLFATPPFDEEVTACAFNVYRLDVASDESGADEPACGGAGTGTTVDTYYDSTYCFDGTTDRLLYGDTAIVEQTMNIWLPEWTSVIVLVNGSKRGGGGGTMSFLSTSSGDWMDVAIHELGHSLFDLADEYDDDMPDDDYPGGEPMRVNVTTEPDPTLVKWNGLVTAGPATPTLANADCTTGNGGPLPAGVTAADVGTFEGASRYNCGIYRPRQSCKMRASLHSSFCPVCEQRIRDVLSAYAAPPVAGAITLETPALTFADVPEGTSTVRAATWLVDTCLPVTLQVVTPPAAPFSVAFEPLVVSTPSGASVRQAKLWLRYDAAGAGTSHTSSVEVEVLETGARDTIALSGNAVVRPTAAVQLVLDRSGSMLDVTSEGRTKEEVLRDSARILADVAYPDTGLGVTTYDEDAQDVMEISDAGPMGGGPGSGRDALETAIAGYAANPSGMTATGDGIERARTKLDAATAYDQHAMIVLTDGRDTASKGVGEVAGDVINQRVFAIGLGTAEQIDPGTLTALAGATGGYTLMTGLLTRDDTFTLEKYYLQVLAGATNQDIILDPEGRLQLDGITRTAIPFDVAETDVEITGVVLSPYPSALFVGLEAPDGTRFTSSDAGPGFSVTVSRRSHVLRAALPLVDADGTGHRVGRWKLLLRLDEKAVIRELEGSLDLTHLDRRVIAHQSEALADLRRHGVAYSAVVQTYSNLRLSVNVSQNDHRPGATISVAARLTEYGGPLRGSASATLELTPPGGAVRLVPMASQGEGRFEAAVSAPHKGLYRMRVLARGRTYRERPFTREETRTASIWNRTATETPGGGRPGGGRGGDGGGRGLLDLLCCLLRAGALDDRFYARAADLGIDPKALRACLKRLCASRRAGQKGTEEVSMTVDPGDLRRLKELDGILRRVLDVRED